MVCVLQYTRHVSYYVLFCDLRVCRVTVNRSANADVKCGLCHVTVVCSVGVTCFHLDDLILSRNISTENTLTLLPKD